MTNRFLVSVAALALIAGTGFANAQGTGTKDHGSGQQTQHSTQPSGERSDSMNKQESMDKQDKHEKGTVGQAGSMKDQPSAHDKSTQSDKMNKDQPGAMREKSTQSEKSSTVGQSPRSDEKSKGSMSRETETKGSKDMKAQGQEDRSGMNAPGHQGSQTQTQTQTGTERSQTTGQAGAAAKLSTEQRTQITSVIREEHVAPVTNVNFSISVGTRIPREGITLHALPSKVVTIYPEWRTYKYVLIRDEIVIVNPDTYEIVAVLNA
ncbi:MULTISPECIES: DUF1236 domain-containing protein [Bradyrhizobium]|uniref:DUF1236 domain-containing protein n=1 Tax=Bradyrhizobium vignae TaxID=1549949 RepID=A0A2U3Q2X6_9BRAD|nr:DUF1236 domain-containing protein [Bradyrhizobium vignae]MBP0113947.1 DUF1236 domain-containing protein [Bradyrhizobium vignae]SPP95716.1 conserved exported protein of unknown function [Bradyrhizobium vignae]